MADYRCLLTVTGIPQPQGSLRAFAVGGRARVTQGGSAKGRQKLGDWRLAIAAEARRWIESNGPHDPWDEPVCISVAFWLPRPASAPKRRTRPDRKPDLDKLVRSLLDSLSGVIFTDDARVVSIYACKHYAVNTPPRADVCIYAMSSVPEPAAVA